MNGAWLDPQVEMLKELWRTGDSCSAMALQINRKFGTAYSRNAVIGKASRLGLPMRVGSIRDDGTKAKAIRVRRSAWMVNKRRQDKAKRPGNPDLRELIAVEAYVEPREDVFVPPNERRKLPERDQCKWPIGDPREPDYHVCNFKRHKGLPYCEIHARRAFNATAPARPVQVVPFPVQVAKHAQARKEKADA